MRKTTYDKLIYSLSTLLRTTPYDEMTISCLCAHAGVTRRTFYKKFQSIDSLVQDFFIQIFYEHCYPYAADESYFESDSFIYTMIRIWDRYGELFIALEKWSVLEYLTRNNITIISDLIREKCSVDFVVENSEYFIVSTYATLANICMVWLKKGRQETPDELAAIIKKFVYRKDLNKKTNR